jgi:hypothetical protein
VSAKPTVEELGIDADAQAWRRSGEGTGAIEVAFVGGDAPHAAADPHAVPVSGAAPVPGTADGPGGSGGSGGSGSQGESGRPGESGGRGERADWVLMRVAGDPAARVLVFDRNEWECFLDGARNGEFDDVGDAPALTGLAGLLTGRTVPGGGARSGAAWTKRAARVRDRHGRAGQVPGKWGNDPQMPPYSEPRRNLMGFHS